MIGLNEVVCRLYADANSRESFPNLLKLGGIALVQCCSPSKNERGFLLRTLINTNLRNRFGIESLDDCMRIKLCGEEEPKVEFLQAAYRRWLSRKPRRIWKNNPAVIEALGMFDDPDNEEEVVE